MFFPERTLSTTNKHLKWNHPASVSRGQIPLWAWGQMLNLMISLRSTFELNTCSSRFQAGMSLTQFSLLMSCHISCRAMSPKDSTIILTTTATGDNWAWNKLHPPNGGRFLVLCSSAIHLLPAGNWFWWYSTTDSADYHHDYRAASISGLTIMWSTHSPAFIKSQITGLSWKTSVLLLVRDACP